MLLLFARTLPSSVLWCCLLPCAKVPAPGRRFDVVPDVVPHAAQLVLKTRHSLGPPMVGCPADLDVKEKEICMWPWHSMCCPADCTVLSVLAGVLNVQHIGACSCWPTSCSIVSKQGLLFTAGCRFDVVPDVVPPAAQPVLKTRHSLGPPICWWLWTFQLCCPADLEVKEKETCLLAVLNVQHIGACSCWPTSCSIVSKQGLLLTAARGFDVVPDVVPHAAQPATLSRFCGVFLWWWCGGVFLWWWCGCVFVVVWWCFCGGDMVVFLWWWCFLWWCFCGVFVLVWWCFCVFNSTPFFRRLWVWGWAPLPLTARTV